MTLTTIKDLQEITKANKEKFGESTIKIRLGKMGVVGSKIV